MVRPPSGRVRGSDTRRHAILAGGFALVVLAVGAVVIVFATRDHAAREAAIPAHPKPTLHTEESRAPVPRRLFAARSPWNMPLPASPALDAHSSARVAALAGEVEGQIAK